MNNLDSDEECGIVMAGKQEIGFLRQISFPDGEVTVEEEIKKTKNSYWMKLKMDLILILAEYGYPPVTNDEVFKEIFEQALEKRLQELKGTADEPDSITFSGNGEPTLNPDFVEIIDGNGGGIYSMVRTFAVNLNTDFVYQTTIFRPLSG